MATNENKQAEEINWAQGIRIIVIFSNLLEAAAGAIQSLQDTNVNVKKKAIFDLRVQLKVVIHFCNTIWLIVLQEAAFAREFLDANGISRIYEVIGEATGNTLAYALSSLQEAMSYGFGWDTLPPGFIQKGTNRMECSLAINSFITVISHIESSNLNVCRSALQILIHISNSPKHGFAALKDNFASFQNPFSNLVNLLVWNL